MFVDKGQVLPKSRTQPDAGTLAGGARKTFVFVSDIVCPVWSGYTSKYDAV